MDLHRRFRWKRLLVLLPVLWLCAAPPVGAAEDEPQDPVARAYLLWRQGTALHLLGQYELAAELFRKSIAAHATPEGHTFLGWSLSHLDRHEEAIAECKKAIALDADYGNPYNDIGVYLIDLGRPEEAVPWLKKAMKARRYCCYQFPHFNMGRVLLMQGREAEAKRSFERSLSYDPQYEPARQGLAYLKRLGEPL